MENKINRNRKIGYTNTEKVLYCLDICYFTVILLYLLFSDYSILSDVQFST